MTHNNDNVNTTIQRNIHETETINDGGNNGGNIDMSDAGKHYMSKTKQGAINT